MMYRCWLKDVKWLWWGSFEQVIRERPGQESRAFPDQKGKEENGGRGECKWVGDKQEKD
jgi:hypothetical protein